MHRGCVKSLARQYPGVMEINSDKKLADLIGGNLQAIRTDLGVTLDQVARSLKRAGAKWSTGGVSNIEKARSTPNIQTLILIAYALTESNEKEIVTPLKLLTAKNDDVVRLGDLRLRGSSYNRLLEGDLSEIEMGDLVNGEQRLENAISKFHDSMPKYGEGVKIEDIEKAQNEYSLADQRAAKKIGIEKEKFIGSCIRLWGHILSIETERRALPNSSPQAKGLITRKLIDELKQSLQDES